MPNIRRTPPKSTDSTNLGLVQSEPDIARALSDSQESSNVSSRHKRPRIDGPLNTKPKSPIEIESSVLLAEIRLLRQEICDLKQQNTVIDTKLSSVSETLDQKLESLHKKIMARDDEITLLKGSIAELQYKLDNFEHKDMKSELEIVGIPEESNENLVHLVMLTSKKIGIQLLENDIDEVYRIGQRRADLIGKPRSIVLRLARRIMRNDLLRASKGRRPLTSEDIVRGTSTKVFINERLSRQQKELFREARARAQLHRFRYCWVRNGTVFVRKAEKAPAIPVRTPVDLDEKIGLPQAVDDNQSKDNAARSLGLDTQEP